jgi:hypothetical protein
MYYQSDLTTEEEMEELIRQHRVEKSVLLKANWAKDHITDLDIAMNRFFETNPYGVVKEKDAATGEYVFRFVGMSPYPRDIVGHVSDALHNLRSTLDLLVWQLVLANGIQPNENQARDIYFPIHSSSLKKITSLIRLDAVQYLETWVGHKTLRLLHDLDRFDKHREILGIGTSHLGHINPERNAMIVAPHISMLKPGDVILRLPDKERDPKIDFRFAVSFEVPNVAEGLPVLDTLLEMQRIVFEIVLDSSSAGHFRKHA